MMHFRSAASLIATAACLFIAQIPGSAQASTVTYDLVLTANSGPESGTGSFTITTPVLGTSGFDTVGNGALTAMSFFIDGMTFSLANATSAGVGFNFNGLTEVLNNIGYTGQNASFVFQLSTGGFGYSFSDSANSALQSSGVIVASVEATPLPAALPLFAGGLGIIGLLSRRRMRKARQAFATAV
jgi:hypothetical protein